MIKKLITMQNLLKDRIKQNTDVTLATASALLSSFSSEFDRAITGEAKSEDVAGFKSVACYRTGLDVSPIPASLEEIEDALMVAMKRYIATGKLRLADKAFNDYLVRVTMEVAGKYSKPGSSPFLFFFPHLRLRANMQVYEADLRCPQCSSTPALETTISSWRVRRRRICSP